MPACYNSEFLSGTVNPINTWLGIDSSQNLYPKRILRTLKGHKHTFIILAELEPTNQDFDPTQTIILYLGIIYYKCFKVPVK